MKLDKLTIRGFKSIRALDDFELRDLNVLIGGNGSGKSNFVEFFKLVVAVLKTIGLHEYTAGNTDAYLFGGPKNTKTIVVKMCFTKQTDVTLKCGYGFALTPMNDRSFLVSGEHVMLFNGSLDALRDNNNYFDSFLHQASQISQIAGLNNEVVFIDKTILSWQVYHFHDTTKEAGMRRYQSQDHYEKLFEDAANIAPFLLMLREKHPEAYRDILNVVRLVMPFFDNFILEPDNNENVRLNWRQKGLNDYPMRPSQLSDGSIRFICLVTALLQPNPPSAIVIDEPELGLHPAAIAILAELIESASRRTQVIVATQSPALIDYFGIEDIVVVNRKNGESTFERLKEEDFNIWLEEYSVGELWRKNVIAGGPVYE